MQKQEECSMNENEIAYLMLHILWCSIVELTIWGFEDWKKEEWDVPGRYIRIRWYVAYVLARVLPLP
jgi:hypothetical protein